MLEIITFLKENGAWCPAPKALPAMFEAYPADYKDFLLHVDGFHWEGLIFFGVSEVEPDLSEGKKILGKTDDGLIFIYDEAKGCFDVLEKASRDVFDTYKTFPELLKSVVDEKIQDLKELENED